MLPLILIFTLVPILELWLLVQLSGVIGFWTTIGLILGTGMAGAALARWQGFQAIERVQAQMRQGVMPAQAIGDGAMILAAGILLISPGLLSDIAGLLLLIPPVRKLVLKGIRHWFATHVRVETHSFHADPQSPGQSTIIDAKVIDARVVDVQDDEVSR
jgi:UPF0716 protein FxsA